MQNVSLICWQLKIVACSVGWWAHVFVARGQNFLIVYGKKVEGSDREGGTEVEVSLAELDGPSARSLSPVSVV